MVKCRSLKYSLTCFVKYIHYHQCQYWQKYKNKVMAKEMKFEGLRKTIFGSQSLVEFSDEEKQKLFDALVSLLIRNGVFYSDGVTRTWRSGCVDYLLSVIPRLEVEEFMLLKDDRNAFYQKYCFKPSAKKKSLYSELSGRGVSDTGRYMNIPVDDIYHQYTSETGFSPYEFLENPSEVIVFLDAIEPFTIFNPD